MATAFSRPLLRARWMGMNFKNRPARHLSRQPNGRLFSAALYSKLFRNSWRASGSFGTVKAVFFYVKAGGTAVKRATELRQFAPLSSWRPRLLCRFISLSPLLAPLLALAQHCSPFLIYKLPCLLSSSNLSLCHLPSLYVDARHFPFFAFSLLHLEPLYILQRLLVCNP